MLRGLYELPVEAEKFPPGVSGFFPVPSHLGSVVMVPGPGECCSVICRDILCFGHLECLGALLSSSVNDPMARFSLGFVFKCCRAAFAILGR